MGRFNWIWKTLRTLSVVMCGVCLPITASALVPEVDRNLALGACEIGGQVSGGGFATVS